MRSISGLEECHEGQLYKNKVGGPGQITATRNSPQPRETSLEERVQERMRIARELHDTLLQSLHGLLFRHNAHGFIYVLEGSIVMQVRGGKETIVNAGQTFYEGPEDVHVVGRNASQTQPAKFVVFFVKDKAAPIVVPAS